VVVGLENTLIDACGWTAALVLGFWILLGLDRKRWWPVDSTLPAIGSRPLRGEDARGRVAVIVPARNEAEFIPRTLPALLRQSGSFSVLALVDDRSDDGTAAAAGAAIRTSAEPAKARVIAGEPPPPGWSGKLSALRAGLEAAMHVSPGPDGGLEWILFTDADILHPESSIDRLLEKAVEGPYDLVSIMARLRARSFWERLLVPPFLWFFQLLYPFRRVADPRSRVAAAAGGCVLVRRSVLERAGGLEGIRGEVIDDVALARSVQRAGGRLWLGLDPGVESLRAYESLGDIVDLVARTAFTELRHSVVRLALTLASLAIFFVSPPVLVALGALTGRPALWAPALAAWVIQAALYLPAVRHARVSPLVAATLPLATLLYAYMTAVSAWRHWRGRGAKWKGRTYAGR